MREYTKDEVLKREEIILDRDINYDYFSTQGTPIDNQCWHGEKCYIPCKYKAQLFKLRINIKNNNV